MDRVNSTTYADLSAIVYPDAVPDGLLSELPSLYSSLFSTQEWWLTQDKVEPTGACVLEGPRHVLLFHIVDDTVEILNKVFRIDPAELRRACRALFRALPHVRRVHVEILFSPKELGLPHRTLHSVEHMVIDLPATPDQYLASLGKRTRGNLRNFENRLRRDHPDLATEIIVAGAAARRLFDQFLEWKIARFHDRGRVTFWENAPYQTDQVIDLMSRTGEAHVTTIAGSAAAIRFLFPVGDTTYALQGAFDPDYEIYRLGLLSVYWAIGDAIGRGLRHFNLLWGTTDYKSHLGARPMTATQISVFRSQIARLYSADEAWLIARRELRRSGARWYWDGRHRLRRTLERGGLLPHTAKKTDG